MFPYLSNKFGTQLPSVVLGAGTYTFEYKQTDAIKSNNEIIIFVLIMGKPLIYYIKNGLYLNSICYILNIK